MSGPADVPGWVQAVIVAAGGIGVFGGTLFSYIKKGKQNGNGGEVAVVSASFADRRTIEGLADSNDRLERTMHDLCEESRRARQAVVENTDAQINMLRFMKGRTE